jgi:hypothetical protein
MSAEELVGSVSWSVFIFVTLALFGWVAIMAATALARMWRPWWQNVFYALILGVADRLLEMMLFRGPLLSLRGYLLDTTYIVIVMLLAYRAALTRRMLMQYPWLYVRAGLFEWRAKPTGNGQ